MKTAILAAGALAVATLSGVQSAAAKDAHFSLTLAGPGGTFKISSPGPGGHAYGAKGYGYGQGYNPYGYGKGKGYPQPYYGGPGYSYGYPYSGPNYGYGQAYYPKMKRHGRGYRPHRRHCMAPREMRWMLKSQGWYGFDLKKLTSGIAVVYSHRHGQRYRIKIDRCKYAIIKVSPRGGFY